jgi:hypothetical protein
VYNILIEFGVPIKLVRLIKMYKSYISGHYPSSYLYLKTPSSLYFKTQRFGDWIMYPSSGKTYSVGSNR